MTISLTGIGASLPQVAQTNDELAEILDTSDQWIRTRTGIGQRWVASGEECTSSFAIEAGRQALDSAGTNFVDLVIVATSTPDRSVPATAPLVAEALGMSGTPAFDINAVCTGFVYALSIASAMLQTGAYESALVIGADTFTSILDPSDRSTRSIFGDGAGAVVVRSDGNDPFPFHLGSDGSGYELITRPASGSASKRESDAGTHDPYFLMAGKPVFLHAVKRMSEACGIVLDQAGMTVDQIDCLVAHQANSRILAAVVDQLGISADKASNNIERVGNTVAASIPIALSDAHQETSGLKSGDRLLLTAFGGGLTWGACIVMWAVASKASSFKS